jgi:uncharacterized BrkB/YihY/UPF0761 family membrane protein
MILALFRVLLRLLRAIKRKFGHFWLFCRCLTWRTLREVSVKAGEQRLPGLSAEMAYNSMLALFPGLLAVLSAIALFEPLQSTLYQIAGLLGEVIPDDVRNLIRSSLKEILLYRNQQLFSLSYGPSRNQRDIPIFSGAVFAAILWALISALFRFYVLHLGNFSWTYATIGTFIVLLLWLYLCSLVMLIGAQLNVTVGKAMKLK